MADNETQHNLMVNGDLTLVNHFTDSQMSPDLQHKNIEVMSTSDILQRAFDEAGGFEQTLLSRSSDHNSVIQDNIQHLSDHSYIHTDSSLSQNLSSTCNDSNKDLELHNLQFSSDTDLQTPQDLETDFAHETGQLRLCMNQSDKLKIDQNDLVIKQNVTNSITISSGDSNSLYRGKATALPFILKSKTEPLSLNTPTSSLDSVISLKLPLTSIISHSRNESITSVESVVSSNLNTSSQNLSNPNLQFLLKQSTESKSNTLPSSTSNNASSLILPTKQTNAPLGSVNNPIQIIHNGTSYHSTQILTSEQLQQITHVLQQQHAKKLANGGKSSILFEPNTRTRIVCRVVHPSELQKKTLRPDSSKVSSHSPMVGRGRGRPKARDKSFEEDDKNSSLSKEEREEKKKHRPRTRSGRISKPPNHLTKDYKRIHPLDLNDEAYDDSDGGYSDYHVSEEESSKSEAKTTNLPPGKPPGILM